MSKILITGAAGNIGQQLTAYLQDKHSLRLVDVDFTAMPEKLQSTNEVIETDLAKLENWPALLVDIDYVIQLAGNPAVDAEMSDLMELNYRLPYNFFHSAKDSVSLKRVIYASSFHASTGYPADIQVKVNDKPRPDSLYGVSKVYLENLASYYAYQHGVESIGIRIAAYTKTQDKDTYHEGKYEQAEYLSEADMNHLIDCCLKAELIEPALVVNGLSNNTFKRIDIETARQKLDYQPKDNGFEL